MINQACIRYDTQGFWRKKTQMNNKKIFYLLFKYNFFKNYSFISTMTILVSLSIVFFFFFVKHNCVYIFRFQCFLMRKCNVQPQIWIQDSRFYFQKEKTLVWQGQSYFQCTWHLLQAKFHFIYCKKQEKIKRSLVFSKIFISLS